MPPQVWLYSYYEGKNYGVPNLFYTGKAPFIGMWRMDWLKNAGIDKVPETLDEMHDAFVAFTNGDPDKNGKKDTYGMTGDLTATHFTFTEIFGAFGVLPFNWMEVDGKVVYGGLQPETKQALALLAQWYKEGLISPDFITDIKTERHAIKNASPTRQSKFLKTLNRVFDRQKQRENLLDKLDELFFRYSQVTKELEMAIRDAENEILALQNILISWGNEAGQGSDISLNAKVLDRVREDTKLFEISQLLGKYKKMLIDKRKNSFTYGEGEKYDLTTGNDINTCLSADMALLSTPQTQPLFIHKFMNGSLTQYRKREAVAKAKGDIIVCVDGSGSMSGVIAWAMALALALQEIAAEDNRKFALIQFGDKDELRMDEFLPGLYTPEDVMNAASYFFNGGTNFERPLNEVMQLIEKGYQNAEVAFVTDGKCRMTLQKSLSNSEKYTN